MAISLNLRRIGPHHFAYLRAVAQGIPPADCARRHLGILDNDDANATHQLLVQEVRAAARCRGEHSIRLIGLSIPIEKSSENPSDGASSPNKRTQRRLQLQMRQMALLKKLEQTAAYTPNPTDPIDNWLESTLVRKMELAGVYTLGELNARISTGKSWYKPLPAIGKTKAQHLETLLRILLPHEVQVVPFFGNTIHDPWMTPQLETKSAAIASLLGPISVEESVEAWIAARSNSIATRKAYSREIGRFLVWLKHERADISPTHLTIQDAIAFNDFLRDIPAHFISKHKASPGEMGWAPFRGQLSPVSRKQALTVVSSWLDWLVEARHIAANPFRLISKKQGDNPSAQGEVKAISEKAMQALVHYFEQCTPKPAVQRMLFLLRFVEAMGLRASELLAARLSDLVNLPEGLALKVHGKGAKNRHVTLNRQAREALNTYLANRGLGDFLQAPPETPILASTTHPMTPIGYPALYETVKRWLAKAVSGSHLPIHEKQQLQKASVHWLRHTFGTRLIEKGAAPDAIQSSMGHSSPLTLSRYTRSSAKRQFSEVAKVFGK